LRKLKEVRGKMGGDSKGRKKTHIFSLKKKKKKLSQQ